MSKRAPSAPPRIDGFEYVELIGSGGFSDVFLYEQRRPRRRVAVKVLLAERSAAQRAAFDAEADLMATLSTHPSIVTMYEAGIASGGRPYLAMEYCSRPNLGARYRTERLTVAEALRISVQIAGAVETAHRAGILHRDIKPANILVTEYGHPALTDFGISSTVDASHTPEGMSIPWSPPESFGDPPVFGVATDVWALAATTYTLLAGRSPFEVPGGPNRSADLVARIEHADLAPTGRDDVPPALERILATAMSKRPASRYPSVLAYARALQQVQDQLQLAVTPIDLLDDVVTPRVEEDDDDPATRLRSVVSIDPNAPAPAAPPVMLRPVVAPTAPADAGLDETVHRGAVATGTAATGAATGAATAELDDATALRGAVVPAATGGAPADAPASFPPATRRTGRKVLFGALAVVAVAAVVVVPSLLRHDDAPPADTVHQGASAGGDQAPPDDNLATLVPPVRDLAGQVTGDKVVFTWQPPKSAVKGDVYAWALLQKTGEPQYREVTDPTVTVPVDGDQTCVAVVVVRSGRFSDPPAQECVP